MPFNLSPSETYGFLLGDSKSSAMEEGKIPFLLSLFLSKKDGMRREQGLGGEYRLSVDYSSRVPTKTKTTQEEGNVQENGWRKHSDGFWAWVLRDSPRSQSPESVSTGLQGEGRLGSQEF